MTLRPLATMEHLPSKNEESAIPNPHYDADQKRNYVSCCNTFIWTVAVRHLLKFTTATPFPPICAPSNPAMSDDWLCPDWHYYDPLVGVHGWWKWIHVLFDMIWWNVHWNIYKGPPPISNKITTFVSSLATPPLPTITTLTKYICTTNSCQLHFQIQSQILSVRRVGDWQAVAHLKFICRLCVTCLH